MGWRDMNPLTYVSLEDKASDIGHEPSGLRVFYRE